MVCFYSYHCGLAYQFKQADSSTKSPLNLVFSGHRPGSHLSRIHLNPPMGLTIIENRTVLLIPTMDIDEDQLRRSFFHLMKMALFRMSHHPWRTVEDIQPTKEADSPNSSMEKAGKTQCHFRSPLLLLALKPLRLVLKGKIMAIILALMEAPRTIGQWTISTPC